MMIIITNFNYDFFKYTISNNIFFIQFCFYVKALTYWNYKKFMFFNNQKIFILTKLFLKFQNTIFNTWLSN